MEKELYKAYLAGLIDGEGSILLERVHANEHRSPAVSISTTTPELFDNLIETYGGSISTKKERNGNLPAVQYKVKGDRALALLNDILPYLKHYKKISRAKHLIDNYKNVTARNGKYSEEKLKLKLQFEEDFFKL